MSNTPAPAPTPAPTPALKGKLGGNCNRTDCQRPGATWFNVSTRRYYCAACAREINDFAERSEGITLCWHEEDAAR